jgi:flavin-dependent dehydrogenase
MRASSDIVIVGGGPAGLSTALALVGAAPARASRVVVLEKSRYPRDKFCAGAIGTRGVNLLAALEALPDVPFVPIDGVSFRGRLGRLKARVAGIGRVVRRIEFDHALAEIVRARGVKIEEDVKVEAIDDANGQAATVRTSKGDLSASVVIGADGVGSVVRKSMGLSPGTLRAQVLELDTELLPSDGPRSLIHFDASDARIPGYAWDFPTLVEGRPMVCRGLYVLRLGDTAVDVRALLGDRLAAMGLDIADYKNKRFAERGYDPSERVTEGRRMLVGEAAGIDPVTGEGIAQAIEYGFLAGRFLARTPTPDVSRWSMRLRRSRLAWDLLARERFVSIFYGRARPSLERFFLDVPESLHLGCQHFGGLAYDPRHLAKVAARLAVFMACAGMSRARARLSRR